MMVIGHRGAAGHMPENTIAAFKKALEFGVDGVELDVHLCASGEPVVIHDEKLERTTSGKGYVRERTLEELKSLDAGQGESLSSLHEVLVALDRKCKVFIEIKADEAAIPTALLVEQCVLKRGWEYDQLILIAFHHHLLKDVRRMNARLHTGTLLVGNPINYAQIAVDAEASYVLPSIQYVNAPFVQDAHAKGLKVCTWTANSKEQVEKAKLLNVDGIMSDYPDRVR